MATLTEAQKVFIVQALACFRTPSEALGEVVARWPSLDGSIDRRQVHDYHPKRAGRTLPKKWHDLFDATRAKYLTSAAEIGVASQVYRLEGIQGVVRKARRMKNAVLELAAYEQAAKEVGGAFTNKRDLTGRVGLDHSGEIKVDHEPKTKKEVDDVLKDAGVL